MSIFNDKSQQVGPAMAHSNSTINGYSGLLCSAEREREIQTQLIRCVLI